MKKSDLTPMFNKGGRECYRCHRPPEKIRGGYETQDGLAVCQDCYAGLED